MLAQDLISVVVRFHDIAKLEEFEQCIFSVCLQNIEQLELVVVVKNFDQPKLAAVESTCAQQPWLHPPIIKIVDCSTPDGGDTRALALKSGIETATGRYLAFLDHDDVVYHDCYATLKNLLHESKAIVAFGRTRLAVTKNVNGNSYNVAKKKWFFWGDSRRDLWKGNFIVIHSYMIDRDRLPVPLTVDTSFSRLEDYALLLKLSVEGEFVKTEDIVCEYRIPLGHELCEEAFDMPCQLSEAQKLEYSIWHLNTEKLNSLKEGLRVNMSLEQFSELMDELAQLKTERARLYERLAHSDEVWSKHLEEAELLSFRLLRQGHAAVAKPGLLRETVKHVRTFRKFFKKPEKQSEKLD